MKTENRSIRVMGQAFGTGTALNIELNGKTIFNSVVSSSDAPLPSPGIAIEEIILAEIANIADIPTNFEGHLPMSVTVTGGNGVIFTDILSNYAPGNLETSGSSTAWSLCYTGFPPNSEGTPDIRTNVKIDGVEQHYSSNGIWCWIVPAGGTITCDFNISKGQVGNVPETPEEVRFRKTGLPPL
jgi:hypothetical protein